MSASLLKAESQARVNWPLEMGILLWGTRELTQAMRISSPSRSQEGRVRVRGGRRKLRTRRAVTIDDPSVSIEIGPSPPLTRLEVVSLCPLVPGVDKDQVLFRPERLESSDGVPEPRLVGVGGRIQEHGRARYSSRGVVESGGHAREQ